MRFVVDCIFRRRERRLILFASVVVMCVGAATAEEAAPRLQRVRHQVEGLEQTISGRIVVQAVDGGLLLETRDGQFVTVLPQNLVDNESTDEEFRPCTAEELAAQLQAEFGAGFEIVSTRRYVIATNAGTTYGRWCGRLFERLQTAFLGYWKRAGLDVHEPAQPLVAVIFADPEAYAAYATRDAGPALAQSQGYYSARTNRIVLTDLTRAAGEVEATREAELLRRLESRLTNVATIVHEATHQIAFNCGLHSRYADNPMWLTEGMAMFFEAPDLKSSSGWRTAGQIHPGRLQQFRDYAERRRTADSLRSLLLTDERFRDPSTAVDAYAESWAFTFFLIREHRRRYVEYLEQLSTLPRLDWKTPEERETMFLEAMETDWETLEREFALFVRRLRAP